MNGSPNINMNVFDILDSWSKILFFKYKVINHNAIVIFHTENKTIY